MSRDARELAGAWRAHQRHDFPAPSPDLACYVEYYWIVSWSYDEPYRQLIVPYPNVHLTFQDGGATLNGVRSRHQIKTLVGAGGVLGVAFRPGAFRPFLGAAVATITDRTLDARDVLRGDLPESPDLAAVEDFLRAQHPQPDDRAAQAAQIVSAIATTPGLTRVDDVAREHGLTVRGVQRLFADHVGVGPKWVVRRYRLHEVTERLAQGGSIDWAALSAELGYADQGHFVRDFKAMFGETPTWYARRY